MELGFRSRATVSPSRTPPSFPRRRLFVSGLGVGGWGLGVGGWGLGVGGWGLGVRGWGLGTGGWGLGVGGSGAWG